MTLLTAAAAALAVAAIAMVLTAIWSRRAERVSVVDTSWGLVFVAISWVSLALSGGTARSALLAVLVSVWGLRLAWHISRRARGHGEDPRYASLLDPIPPDRRFRWALTHVFAIQGLSAWFVSLPVVVAATTADPLGPLTAFGIVVWATGFAFEAIGDRQLRAFKADPANRGQIMDRGLWAWTRHPNYFGDSAMWWGIWLISAEAWPGVLTVLSPVLMTYFLAVATGARLLERTMSHRPGYAAYQQRTSFFIPRPPRRAS